MTAPSPLQVAGARNSFAVMANGSAIDSSIQVLSVECWNDVNRLPRARLILYDGSPSTRSFPLSSSDSFIPGAKLEILAGYDGINAGLFSGVVYKQSLEAGEDGASKLIVDATDNAIKMTLRRSNAIFENMTDSAIIGKLIGNSGLSANVTSTSATQPSVVQYYASDWDLMLLRAELNSMIVTVSAGKVTVAPPETSASAVLTVTYGESLYDVDLHLDCTSQYASSAFQSFSWDPATLAIQKSTGASASVTAPGDLDAATLAAVFSISQTPQQTAGFDLPANLTAWSSGEMMKSVLAKIRGTVSFQGSSLAVVGKNLALAGLGGRFNGNAFISGVHHRIADGRWITTVAVGLSPEWFAASAGNIPAPGAAGLVAPVPGLQTGIVQKISNDPDGEFRVYVTLPLLQASGNVGVWARLGSFYASNAVGAVFYPETGDEVVVAFMNGDPRYPVIVGSVYSKGRAPALPPDDTNKMKGVVTRSQLKLTFNDENQIIQILTPGGHQITLDDKATSITIKDSNGNSASFAKGGVTIDSAADLTLTAKGNINVTAQGNLALKANANVTVDGLQVTATAQTQFSATANAQASVSGNAMLTLKGGLVQIN